MKLLALTLFCGALNYSATSTDPRQFSTTAAAATTPPSSSSLPALINFRRMKTTLGHALPPSIQAQTKGGLYGPDSSGCNPGCDPVNGFKCCGTTCRDLEMACD